MTQLFVPGQKLILPGYAGDILDEKKVSGGRVGTFKGFAESGIRRNSRGVVVENVQAAKPIISLPDQEMFDAADVGVPLNDERLSRIANLLDCCFEHMQHLIDGDEDAKEEAVAFMQQMTRIPGIGLHIMKERYGKEAEDKK